MQCQTAADPPIRGTITLKSGWKPVLYLIQPRSFQEIASSFSGLVIDSAQIAADGRFVFEHFQAPAEPALFELCIQKQGSRFANQFLDQDPRKANYCPVILTKGETVSLHADADQFQNSMAIDEPSPSNSALLSLRAIRLRAFDASRQKMSEIRDDHENAILEQEAATQLYRAPLMAFADSTHFMLPALLSVRWVSPEGDYERVPEFLRDQCKKWQAAAPGHPFVGQMCDISHAGRLPLMVGESMPDFSLPMANGDTVSMKSLLGKRLTLLDIWASWCAPCRKENREILAPLWKTYGDCGLQIIGYSLDSSPAAWHDAIKKDEATWVHTSHLQGDNSPFLEVLRLTTIPANFLIDADGKVVAKNLHGEALKAFVQAYVSKK